MNNGQRQTTPVLCDTSTLQWHVAFQFSITDIHQDVLKCSIYHRSKYTTDRKLSRSTTKRLPRTAYSLASGLLGSIQIPLASLSEGRTAAAAAADLASVSSLTVSDLTDSSSCDWKSRVFYLQYSSNNSQLALQYRVCFHD